MGELTTTDSRRRNDSGTTSTRQEAHQLAAAIISDLNTKAEQNKMKTLKHVKGSTLSEETLSNYVDSAHENAVAAIEYHRNKCDVEALRLHARLIPCSLGTQFERNMLNLLISDLRSIKHTDIENIVDMPMVKAFGDTQTAIILELFDQKTAFTSIERSPAQHAVMQAALRTASALGSPKVSQYISDDYNRAMELASENDITHYTEMIALVESRLSD